MFQSEPLRLGKIELIDSEGQRVIVTFFDMKLNKGGIDKNFLK